MSTYPSDANTLHTPRNDHSTYVPTYHSTAATGPGFLAGAAHTDASHSTFIDRSSVTYINHAPAILATLNPVARDSYYVQPCMERTRESILKDVDSWLEDFNAQNTLWIKGCPGSGKSAIASSLVSRLTKRRRLGSSFAFKRGDIVLSDPAAVWRTVAHDLTRYDAAFASILIKVLESGTVDPGRPDIASHFECLIREPLTMRHEHSSPHTIPVIVIDALDECGSELSQAGQRRALLNTIIRWSHMGKIFKLIVTGRDDQVPESFRATCRQIELPTGAEVDMEANHDIRLLFIDRLGETLALIEQSEKILDTLVTRAAGLFIWAETVIRFVEQGLPDTQLQLVLDGDLGGGDNVTQLYRQILELLFQVDTLDARHRHTLDVFNQIVSTIILAKTPLHIDDLPQFISESPGSVKYILNKLSSVISIRGGRVYIQHLSFSEFMCDLHRCPQPFYIDRGIGSRMMSLACLRLMKVGLKFNICDLETSYLPNARISDLPERIAKNIRSSLLYSCRFWAAHIRDTPPDHENSALIMEIKDFIYVRFLYWLEVMSVTERIPQAITALLAAANWVQVFDTTVSDFIRDGRRFIINFPTPITESTPHIYLSALPFSPEDSLIANHYRPQFPNTLSLLSGRNRTWPSCINVLLGHTDFVISIAYSPDGKRLASGSLDKCIRIWDAETGEMLAGPLEGHTHSVSSVLFSPDGKRLASASNEGSICVWDSETGEILTAIQTEAGEMLAGLFYNHRSIFNTTAFSPDGKWLAAGSIDGSICVLDTETGEMLTGPFKGHTGHVNSIAFSPDGKQLASGSSDKSVRIWDTVTGDMLAGPFEGHTNLVTFVAFSLNGKLASGSFDKTICVWDTEASGMPTLAFNGHTDNVNCIAFSPDGKWLASGSEDQTICIWDIETGEMLAGSFEGHTVAVYCVAFSPDGKRFASGSADNSIRIWDTVTDKMIVGPSKVDMDRILSITFSSDGKRLASGSDDKLIRVWDAETGEMLVGPFEGHTEYVNCVVFSPDGKQLASASDDGSICVWDAETGEMLTAPFEGHAGPVFSIAYSPDGKQLASSSFDQCIYVWDSETGDVLAGPFEGHAASVNCIAFSPDGQRLASGSLNRSIYIWDTKTGDVLAGPFKGHAAGINCIAFSPEGKWLASCSDDKSICFWDTITGEMVNGPFEGHTDCVNSIAFSPDGKQLASGSTDKTIRVWDTETGEMLAGPFDGHIDWVYSIAFSPDGKQLASSSFDSSIRIWHAEIWGTALSCFKRHLSTVISIGGDNILSCFFLDERMDCLEAPVSQGWMCSPRLRSSPEGHPVLILWVPHSNRKGLCGMDTLLVLGTQTTRLDLSRFVHGTSWAQCQNIELPHPESY